MAIISNSGVVTNNEVLFDYRGLGNAKGVGVVAYINYLANGDNVTMKMKYNEGRLNEDYYYNVTYDGSLIKITEYNFDGTGMYRIPIPVSLNEDYIILEFGNMVNSEITIEFSIDGSYQ